MIVTVYKNALDIKNPHYVEVDFILERIKSGKIKKKIDALRAETDEKKRKELKKMLPSICFSGKFTDRTNATIEKHSGLCVIDFDHVNSVIDKKQQISSHPFVYACFISPSGDGIKAVIRIPSDINRHQGHYEAILKLFPELDTTSKNISRVCFESYDPEIYINKNAVEFTEYVDQIVDYQKEAPMGSNFKYNDYSKANIALKMIREAQDGQKHTALLKASILMGGLVSGGLISESEACRLLEDQMRQMDNGNFEGDKKTIKDGIEHGKINPIIEEAKESTPSYSRLPENKEDISFIANDLELKTYLDSIRDGTFKLGLTTGIPELDEYFRFKESNIVTINGHDNVGKSTIIWYLATLSAILHNWNWIIFSAENKSGGIFRKIIEFRTGKSIKSLTDIEYKEYYNWAKNHFTIIKNEDSFTYKDIIEMSTRLFSTKKYNGLLVDPYNSLYRDKDKSESVHDYDYDAMGNFRLWANKMKCSVYINCHSQTEAARRVYSLHHEKYPGLSMPPGKADTEGGGKFANRTDDFITIHRMAMHKTDWMYNEFHVRKIREEETGGKQTVHDEPFLLKMIKGGIGFETKSGFNPIEKINNSKIINSAFKSNSNFINEINVNKYIESKKDNEEEVIPF